MGLQSQAVLGQDNLPSDPGLGLSGYESEPGQQQQDRNMTELDPQGEVECGRESVLDWFESEQDRVDSVLDHHTGFESELGRRESVLDQHQC